MNLENRIIFPADSSGEPIINNNRAVTEYSPIGGAAQIGDKKIIFTGDITEIEIGRAHV